MKRIFLTSKAIIIIGSCHAFGATHLSQVLEKLGLEKTDVDTITGLADDAPDFKPDDFVTKVSTGYETKLLNNADFLAKLKLENLPDTVKKPIEQAQYGRFLNEFRAVLTKQGIDISDLSDEEKNGLTKLATKSFEKYTAKLGSPDALKTMQADLQKALSDNTSLKADLPTKVEEGKKEVKTQMQAQITKLVATNELSGIKGFKVKPNLVVDGLLSSVSDKYTVIADGTKVTIMQKEQPTLKALTSDGKEITFAMALAAEAKEAELIGEVKEDNKEEIDPKTGKVKVTVDGDKVSMPSYIADKMKDNLELEGKK